MVCDFDDGIITKELKQHPEFRNERNELSL